MNEYKITYSQMATLMEAIQNGYECQYIQEYQGYMTVYLVKNNDDNDSININLETIR